MACVMFVSPWTCLTYCVWCDRKKQFFPFVCECDYCRSRLLDIGTASWRKVCDLHRTSCLVACRVVCSAIHKDVLFGNCILCSFFCCCSPAASRKVYPIMNHCEHKVHLVEHGIDSVCKVFNSFILAM